MADWHHLTHKTTGEEQTVASLAGVDLADWKPAKLPRAPKVGEQVVDGAIVKRPGHADEARERSTIVHLTIADLNALIDARIAAASA